MEWTVVIPAKALPEAKSRLVAASSDGAGHRRLVEAIRADTVSAALATPGVARVLVVIDRRSACDGAAGGAHLLVQHSPGLNGALRDGAEFAAREWAGDGVAALVGDLPALRPLELADALRTAAGHSRCYVPDASGLGTTMLAARPGHDLRPAFGADSARHHSAVAVPLTSGPGLRHDIDTADDLARAATLGFGPATTAELAGVAAARRSPCTGIVGS